MVISKLKNKSIDLTEDQLKKIYHFVYETTESHQANDRNIETIQDNIQLGKKAEFILKNLCDISDIPCTDVKLENNRYGDGGFDHIIDNFKTDVKALDKLWKGRVYLGSSSTNDMWTLIMINGNRGEYIGSLLRKDIKVSDLHYDSENNNAVYISKDLFVKSLY